MGVVIVGTGVSTPSWSPLTHGARRLADRAATACLQTADSAADAIDVLINVGVYREKGLGEPALAALIQEDVEANAGRVTPGRHGTFSFDIDNGACGVLTGADVIRGFLTSRAIKAGMITASDSGPDPITPGHCRGPKRAARCCLRSTTQ
jgi:3-oxoacyl-[acyl-carrier-protein] synthase-3